MWYNMTPIRTVAMRIKALREKRGWTQQQLADEAGISRTYLARIETARHDPTLTSLEKIARALKVKVGRLVD
jgi:transcriptional regulator with XRE-family HTH domain